MIDFFTRHEKVVLEFSGGKDSLACLFLLQEYWGKFDLLWCNTGDSFPETRELVYSFGLPVLEVRSDQPANIVDRGPPSDVLPVWDSPFGRILDETRKFKIQTPFECCSKNIWEPMIAACKEHAITGVIRGQRNSEAKKSPVRSGHKEDGVELWFPLETWSEKRVLDFLDAEQVPLPRNYRYFNSSLDCQHCTAYLHDNVGKGAYLSDEHPDAYRERQKRFRYIIQALDPDYGHLLSEAQ